MRLLYQPEKLRPVKVAKEFDQLRDDTGPARLVVGPKACTIVTVEIFVEKKCNLSTGDRSEILRTLRTPLPARPISQKNPG